LSDFSQELKKILRAEAALAILPGVAI